jgi:hypothetical protein
MFEQVFDNVRKTAEANMQIQQEFLRQWQQLWPGVPNPQTAWLEQVRKIQREWAHTVGDLARKHREVLDHQYQAALDSLEQALSCAQAKDPEEFRKRAEELCRKTLECMRESAEAQVRELQNALTQWTELATKSTV